MFFSLFRQRPHYTRSLNPLLEVVIAYPEFYLTIITCKIAFAYNDSWPGVEQGNPESRRSGNALRSGESLSINMRVGVHQEKGTHRDWTVAIMMRCERAVFASKKSKLLARMDSSG